MRTVAVALLLCLSLSPLSAGGGAPVDDLVVRLRAGQYAALVWDPERQCYEAARIPPALPALPAAAEAALARVPEWLRAEAREQLQRLLLVPVKGSSGPGSRDADGDGLRDELRVRDDDTLVFRRNRGVPRAPAFLTFTRDARRAFPDSFGLASRPVAGDEGLVVANVDGERFRAAPYATAEKLEAAAPGSAPPAAVPGEAPVTAEADLDGDGTVERIAGDLDGRLRLYRGPDFAEVPDAFAGLDVGEAAAPALLKKSDGWQLVVGRLEGDLLLFDVAVTDGRILLAERDSWEFAPTPEAKDLAAFYERSYFPEEEEALEATDEAAVNAYAGVLAAAPEETVDEIAFCVARTPVEVLRVMARLGQASLLADNARGVYDVARQVGYAKIVEKGDRTTLAFAREPGDFVEIPPEVYYFFVVHPRILYEVPCRVDASWWDQTAAARGLSDSDWWKHEPETDVHVPSEKGVFWRRGLLADARFGTTLFDAVKGAKTLRAAAIEVHRFLANGTKDAAAIMRFGYETQDLQPWLIYAKHYGSCGEHSIIGAACARTMLVPMQVVACRGEDHQWNEFFDTDLLWHHFDCCGAGNFDQPWGSSEGMRHEGKTVSTVTGWRGDDTLFATTTTVASREKDYTRRGAGYTDVAEVTVRVVDGAGIPLDGALVIVKSHWESRDLVSIWGYTDGRGEVRFDLGYEPNGGYAIEAYSPYGAAGVQTFPVEENRAYALVLRMPNGRPKGEPAGTYPVAVERAELRPPNLVTGRRYRIGSWLGDTHGYRGAGASPVAVDAGDLVKAWVLSEEEFANYEAGRPFTPSTAPDPARAHYVVVSNRDSLFVEATVSVKALGRIAQDAGPPTVDIEATAVSVPRGGQVTVGGMASDDRRIAALFVEFPVQGGPRDVLVSHDQMTGLFSFVIDAGTGGPLPAGTYEACVVARDGVGHEKRVPFAVTVTPARVFKDQVIRQDDPDDPLKRCSWVYGPFELPAGLPFFLVRTSSLTEGFDMDMHVYRDGNGNARIDGPGEKLTQSAGPSAKERVVLLKPEAGTYWVYCQGFKVEKDSALLTVEVWPEGTPRAVVGLSPVGPMKETPKEIAFRVLPWAVGRRVTVNGKEVSGGPDYRLPLESAEGGAVKVEVEGVETREWSFVRDATAPTLSLISPAPGSAAAEGFDLEVESADENGIAGVAVRIPGGAEVALAAKKDSLHRFAAKLDPSGWPSGELFLVVTSRDRAGNETELSLRLKR